MRTVGTDDTSAVGDADGATGRCGTTLDNMIDTNLQNKARAVVLSALMVLSVMVGTIALSGGAAATAISSDLSEDLVQDGEDIYVNGSVDANGTVYAFIDEDDSGNYTSADERNSVNVDDYTSDDGYSISLQAPDTSGTYDVHVVQDENALEEGNESDITVETLQVDADEPLFGDTSDRKVTDEKPTVSLEIYDENTSVDASSIEVDFWDGGELIHQVNETGSNDDGIAYKNGMLTIDFSHDGLKSLENGETYTAEIVAADVVGNSNSTSFDVTVDTEKPTFTLVQPTDGDTVGEPTQTIEVDVSDTNLNTSTPELTITGPNDYEVVNNSSHDVYDDGTFEVVPGSGGVPELPNGTISVSVSAADEYGNSASDSWSFKVDNKQPIVKDVAVNVYDASEPATDKNNEIAVGIEFNEDVNADSVEATITAGTTEVTLDSFEHSDSQNKDDDYVFENYTVTDDFDGVENSSVEVLITAGEDEVGNSANLTAGDNSTTFAIDTIEPEVSIDSGLPDTFQGRMDLGQYISVDKADGNGYSLFWAEPGGDDYNKIHNPDSVDTRDITEGNIIIAAVAADDNGNVGNATAQVTVDNYEPYAKATKAKLASDDGGTYNVAELLHVYKNGTEAVTQYGWATLDEGQSVDDLTWDDFTESSTVTVTSDERYVFGAEVPDNGSTATVMTAPVEAYVFETGDLDIDVESVKNSKDDNEGHVDITVTSEHKLKKGSVTVKAIDDYDDYKKTLKFDADDKTKKVGGEYLYSITHDLDRDGKYKFSISSAKTTKGQKLVDTGVHGKHELDEEKPELADADVIGTDNGRTQVKLTFDQPIKNLEKSEIEFRDGKVAIEGFKKIGAGKYVVTFEKEIQTGDKGAKITIDKKSYTEKYTWSEHSVNPDDDKVYVDSVELDLKKGANFVSVPIEAGSVKFDDVDFCGCVKSVWAYDDGKWQSYDPDAKENSLTAFEGGQGYIIYAKGDAEVDVRGFTKYDDDGSHKKIPNSPSVGTLDAGWNLIGHFQEGKQDTDYALTTIDQVEEVGVIGPWSDDASKLKPGSSYWVFVEDSDKYAPVKYGDADKDIKPDVSDVEVTEFGTDTDGIVTSGDTVNVSATVTDDNLATQVVDASTLGGPDSLKLTQMGDSDTYNATFDVDAAGDITADDGDVELEVEAIDEGGVSTTGSDSVELDTTVDADVSASANNSTVMVTVESTEELDISVADLADGSSFDDFEESVSNGNYTYTANATDVAHGEYTVDVTEIEDVAGNTDDPSEQGDVSVHHTVDDDGSSDFEGIQAAVDASDDGDIIIVENGTYDGPVTLDTKNITVTAANDHGATIHFEPESVDGQSTVQITANGTTFSDFEVERAFHENRDAKSTFAQGIRVSASDVSVKNNIVTGVNHVVAGQNVGIMVLDDESDDDSGENVSGVTVTGNDVSDFTGALSAAVDYGGSVESVEFNGNDLSENNVTGLAVNDGVELDTFELDDEYEFKATGGADGSTWHFKSEAAALDYAETYGATVTNANGDFVVGDGMSIQAAVDAAEDGDTIQLTEGEHNLTSTVDVTKNVTFVGAGQDETTINASEVSESGTDYGIAVDNTANGTTLAGFTLIGPQTDSAKGVHIGTYDGYVSNITVHDVTVTNSSSIELDLIGVENATIEDVTLDGNDTAGAGLGLSSVKNVTVDEIDTTNNTWGGIMVATNGGGELATGTTNVTITGLTSTGEPVPIYHDSEAAGSLDDITDITHSQMDWKVTSSDHRSGDFAYFFPTEDAANAYPEETDNLSEDDVSEV